MLFFNSINYIKYIILLLAYIILLIKAYYYINIFKLLFN
jgi:hypothetical protein